MGYKWTNCVRSVLIRRISVVATNLEQAVSYLLVAFSDLLNGCSDKYDIVMM